MNINISTYLIGFFFLISIQMDAQKIKDADIIGTWNVQEILISAPEMPAEYKEKMDALKAAFSSSKFIYETDHTFSFDFPIEEMKIENANWKWNDDGQSIIIQEKKNAETEDHLLMEIQLKRSGDKMVFVLEESFLISLVVEKEK